MESALSGSAQHRPCPHKHQEISRKLQLEAQNHIKQTPFSQPPASYCDLADLCLSWLTAHIVFVDRAKSELHGATSIYCCPFPYTLPWNVHTVFPSTYEFNTSEPHHDIYLQRQEMWYNDASVETVML